MKHDQLFGKKPRHLLWLFPAVFLAAVTTASVADDNLLGGFKIPGQEEIRLESQGVFFVNGQYYTSATNQTPRGVGYTTAPLVAYYPQADVSDWRASNFGTAP